jgi:hypothetical protein
VCVLAAAGCGGTHSSSDTTATTPTTTSSTTTGTTRLTDALRPPDASVLKPGAKVTIAKAVLQTRGWQVACIAHGMRINAESVRGQHTGALRKKQVGAREIIGPPTGGGSPSIWVAHNDDGSIVVSCR